MAFAMLIVMYQNLYPKYSFLSCPCTVLVKCPVRFYSIFDEIGENVDGKMYFYHRSHCSTTTIESNGSLFSSLAPANGYAQKNCAERFSALNIQGQSCSQSPRYPYPAERDSLDKVNAGSGNEIDQLGPSTGGNCPLFLTDCNYVVLYHGCQVNNLKTNNPKKEKKKKIIFNGPERVGLNSSSVANMKASSDSSTTYLIFFRWLPVKTCS